MRKLLLFFIVSILACLPAALSWAAELNLNGDFRVRGIYNKNLTTANSSLRDDNTYNTERFILNLEAKSGQGPINVQGVLTTDFTSFNGTGNSRLGQFPFGPASSAAVTCGATGTPPGGGATPCSQNTFSLLQAYLKINTPYANFAVGRQVFKLGLGLVVADAVDALVVDVPIGASAKLTLGDLIIFNSTRSAANGGVFVGNGSGGITGANTDLYLINLNLKPAKETKVDVFASLYTDRGTNFITEVNPALPAFPVQGAANATAGIFGIAAETKQAPIHGIFEADLIRGAVTTPLSPGGELLQGHNILAGADVDVGPANFGLTLVYSSGQDAGDVTSGKRANINGINGDFPLGIITTNVGARSAAPVDGTCPSFTGSGLGGRPGCFAGSGLVTAKFAASYTPPTLPKLNLEIDVLYDRAGRQRPIQSAAASTVFIKGGDYIGTEFDFLLRYAITKEMSLTAGWGYMFAGNFFEAPTAGTVAGAGGCAGGCAVNPTTRNADDLMIGVLELRYQF